VARLVPETRAVRRTRIDGTGTVLLAATLVALLVPLTEGRALGWPLWSVLVLALAPVAGGWLYAEERRVERRGGAPLIPPAVLRHASMRRGLALIAPFFATFGAFMFVYALITQGQLGFSAMKAGLTLTPMALAFLVASLATTRLVARYGRTVITAGALVQLAGLAVLVPSLLVWWPTLSVLQLAPSLALMGVGQGLVMSPLVRVVLSEVPPEVAGAGSGVLTTTQQTSLALGVAVVGSLFVTLASPAHLGPLHAAVVVLGLQAAVALGICLGSRTLPQRRQLPADRAH
jgi:MFS family permease